MTKELSKKYNHKNTEKQWQKKWEEKEIYSWKNDLPKDKTFVIDTPPPTVSGVLHMGHIFSYTQADFVARYKRMRGYDVFYPMGFDDNGLPTERLVEKVKKIRANQMQRDEFIEQCQEVVDEAEIEFEKLFNSIALSVDWKQKYQTISKESQKLSQISFLDLYKKNLVEKKSEPVFFDIADQTALAQADLVEKDVEGAMSNIYFGVEGSDEKIEIMTTRPELLPACVAVMIHPEDKKYKHLHGKKAITAIFGVKVDIITDDLVQMDKGTGAVMCCTFGDETDIKWWRKHNLDLRIILQRNGKISEIFPAPKPDGNEEEDKYLFFGWNGSIAKNQCLDLNKLKKSYDNIISNKRLKEAKENIIEVLKEQGLLVKQEIITRPVKCAERSGVPIEILVENQWFINILDKKEELKAKANECNWYPSFMKVRVEQWIDNLAWDWCISRQRFFGVPFPIWFSKRKGEEGKILIANANQLPCDPLKDLPEGYEREEVDAETDIMDTWATSSISPQLSSKGINPTNPEFCLDQERHDKLFPADLRPQAHEIIRTWAFYTIAKSMLHQDKIPWKNLMISGWCLASDKTKMSKSKGNVVTPTALIEEKGSDVVRYWASTSHLGADTAYSEELFKIGGKLLTKLFNSAKFVSQNFSDLTSQPTTVKNDVEQNTINQISDLWILSRLQQTISKAEIEFDKFEYAKARVAIEDFFWNDFCDNYLEIVKVRSYGVNAQKYENIALNEKQKLQITKDQQSALFTLYHCLETILKLFAPFIPHISEELYQAIFSNKLESIHQRGSWCEIDNYILNENSIKVGQIALEVIFTIRKFKSDNNLSLKTPLDSFVISTNVETSDIIKDLKNVCNVKEILTSTTNGADLVKKIIRASL